MVQCLFKVIYHEVSILSSLGLILNNAFTNWSQVGNLAT